MASEVRHHTCRHHHPHPLGAAVFAEMASALYDQGTSLSAHLLYVPSLLARSDVRWLHTEYGAFATQNKYFFTYDPANAVNMFTHIRNHGDYHKQCGDFRISHIRDLKPPGLDTRTTDHKPRLATTSSDMITVYFDNGAVLTLRGSGTEPKLKYYVGMKGSSPTAAKEVRSFSHSLSLSDKVLQLM